MKVDANTPVIVGVGFAGQRFEDPREAPEAVALMTQAVEQAADDAGSRSLLERADSIQVPKGFWGYSDPARLIADRVGAKQARTVLAGIGILQQTLINNACRAIAAGEEQVAIVTGGEAKYRSLRASLAGIEIHDTLQTDAEPDQSLTSSDPIGSKLEAARGLKMPVEFFAIMESALRHQQGLSIEAHRDVLARLYSEFSRVAADNPHAWKRKVLEPDSIRESSDENPMLASPYSKAHCTGWNVDQASALILCSVFVAEELGVPRERWVFPRAGTESNSVLVLSERKQLHRSRGAALAGERALALADCSVEGLAHLELYSCFPAAVRVFVAELGLEAGPTPSVTGGMPFAGGPLNNFVLQGTARMIEVLREDPGSLGLVSCLSGICGKQGFGVYATEPNPKGFQFEDVTSQVAREEPRVVVVEDYSGEAVIAGYAVTHVQNSVHHTVAFCDLPDGRRAIANSNDLVLSEAMTREEFCGRKVWIDEKGEFSLCSSVD